MKLKFAVLSTLLLVISSCTDRDNLKSDFRNPPASMTTGCYWYWMSDNISREGVVADLKAMKEAGINSAFIGNIGGQGVPYGDVKIFTDEWWDILHTALKTASELNIEIGMFNCPGWSQSGGPWIKPSETMRYLTASETRINVASAGKIEVQLPVPSAATRVDEITDRFIDCEGKPSDDFQDVCVLAVPVSPDYGKNLLTAEGAKVSTSKNILSPSSDARLRFRANVPATSPINPQYILPEGERVGYERTPTVSTISVKFDKPQTARSLTVYPAGFVRCDAELQIMKDRDFQTVKTFHLDRSNPKTFVGYRPFAPVVVAFPATTASEFRLVFTNKSDANCIGQIVLSEQPAVENFPEKTFARLFQGPSPVWEYYQWEQQPSDSFGVPTKEQVVDLTGKMDSTGLLTWDAPDGEWIILRMGMTPTYVYTSPSSPEGTGLEMDKMNSAWSEKHFDSYIGEVMRRIPAKDRKTLKVIVGDSWERGGQTFTDGFIETFKSRYGYDPTPYLPVLEGFVIDNTEVSDRFLWDVRRLTADLGASEYAGGLTAVANRHGIDTWIENYGDWGFPGEFLLYGKYASRIGGEFWVDQTKPYIPVTASAAHIYNKSRVYAEAFTSAGRAYTSHPRSMKRIGDFAFADGMTRCNLHVYIQQAYENRYPGIDTWFGTEFNRKNTWFSQMDLFTTYLKRCGVMLETGKNVADIAYFIGENVPVNCGPLEMRENEADYDHYVSKVPEGYHVDYVNYDVILNSMTVENGLLTLPHGIQYRMLFLPPVETMRPELLEKIERLIADGALVAGAPPSKSPSLQNYPEADRKVQEIAERITGKGLKVKGELNVALVEELGITPDFKANQNKIKYTHRRTADREIYFVSNQNKEPVAFTAEFRVADKTPELWNPVTGEIRALPQFEPKGEITAVPLEMESFESYFVVFSNKNKKSSESTNFPQPEVVAELNTPWTVTFESDSIHRGPSEPIVFTKLTDLSQNDDDRIKYYSGTIRYATTFNLQPSPFTGSRLFLDLEKVSVSAKVKINGKYAGGIWTPPYRLDVADYLKDGENKVEIEVVNTWMNRIIGDRLLPENERKVSTRQVGGWARLQEAGLIGKVNIIKI